MIGGFCLLLRVSNNQGWARKKWYEELKEQRVRDIETEIFNVERKEVSCMMCDQNL